MCGNREGMVDDCTVLSCKRRRVREQVIQALALPTKRCLLLDSRRSQTPTSYTLGAGSLRGLVRQLSIDQFENESRRVSCDSSKAYASDTPESSGSPMFEPSGAATAGAQGGLHRRAARAPTYASSHVPLPLFFEVGKLSPHIICFRSPLMCRQ